MPPAEPLIDGAEPKMNGHDGDTQDFHSANDEVPIIDISPFTWGDNRDAQKTAAKELAEKASINGCVGISGHGVADSTLKEAFLMMKKLFDLPLSEKMKAPHPDGPTPHRGYSGTGRENAALKTEGEDWVGKVKDSDYVQVTDYKESYEIGSESNKEQENIWLPEEVLPCFKYRSTQLYWVLDLAAASVFDALIMSLGMTEEENKAVRELYTGHENQLRLLHYPPVGTGKARVDNVENRLGAHTDWSMFTLLFQDYNGGLQFLDHKSQKFIDAIPREGVLYMNIGDMFQRISNGFYPSALHRVVIKNPNEPRYSIPYFVPPKSDRIIEPQPSLVKRDGVKKYEPITFQEYSEKMFQKINVYS